MTQTDEDQRDEPQVEREAEPLEPRLAGERRRGSLLGSVRVLVRPHDWPLRRLGPRRWMATESAEEVTEGRGGRLRRWLIGRRLESAAESHERLDKRRALAVFASDALSSTAYSTEEILLILVLAGGAYLHFAFPIALSLTLLLTTVVLSYRQTVRAYPSGGGAYSVASDNLGSGPGLLAAAALLTDYVLTVAVSISAGVLAVTSAIEGLGAVKVELALVGLAAITLINMRGVRESGTIFAIPTYLFVFAFGLMIALGVGRLAFGGLSGASLGASAPPREAIVPVSTFGLFLLLRAFSSGATALTGVEAIANGVTAFRAPEAHNAATTMLWMGGILAAFFSGATFLAVRLGIVPVESQSVIAQIGETVFDGVPPMYWLLQASTALILVLAANTAFNDFPRLSAILARDRYMPRRFAFRDDRLTFGAGIAVLAAISAFLLVVFRADTHRLIPLYAVGVFVSFTLSQSGMVIHWRRSGERFNVAPLLNGIGAVATGVVAVVVASTKFTHGAWMVLILVPALVLLLRSVHRHYGFVEGRLALSDADVHLPAPPAAVSTAPMVVPVRTLDRLTLRAVAYARSLSSRVTAVSVRQTLDEGEGGGALEARWARLLPEVPLITIESPYRTFAGPFLSYVDSIPLEENETLTVVLPELETAHWWESVLHNRTARLIEQAAARRPRVICTTLAARLDTFEKRA